MSYSSYSQIIQSSYFMIIKSKFSINQKWKQKLLDLQLTKTINTQLKIQPDSQTTQYEDPNLHPETQIRKNRTNKHREERLKLYPITKAGLKEVERAAEAWAREAIGVDRGEIWYRKKWEMEERESGGELEECVERECVIWEEKSLQTRVL